MTEFSFQLYSARNFLPWEEVYSKLAKAGYTAVEGFGGIFGEMDKASGKALKSRLDAHGLKMPTGHFAVAALETRMKDLLEFVEAAGVETIFAPSLPPEERVKTYDGWRSFGEKLSGLGKQVKAAGFDFGWHNHNFEFATFDNGKSAMDAIFETAPDISWEVDIAWIVKGGADPFVYIDKYGDAITAIHVKDLAPDGEMLDEDGWADAGHGTLPWTELMKAIREKTGARHFVAEHDNPNDLDRMISRAIASFKSW